LTSRATICDRTWKSHYPFFLHAIGENGYGFGLDFTAKDFRSLTLPVFLLGHAE
jgi:hypothetical protein